MKYWISPGGEWWRVTRPRSVWRTTIARAGPGRGTTARTTGSRESRRAAATSTTTTSTASGSTSRTWKLVNTKCRGFSLQGVNVENGFIQINLFKLINGIYFSFLRLSVAQILFHSILLHGIF